MTKYPIILVHGIAIRESKIIKAFGKIEESLISAGHDAYTSEHDAFGSIENNAAQLKKTILDILARTGSEKINIIAHSKGGLDAKYMITKLQICVAMADPLCGVQSVVSEATFSSIPSSVIIYLASNPPLEWAIIFTFSAPLFSNTSSMYLLSCSPLVSILPNPSVSAIYTLYPSFSNS